ncbi:hypothetical protein [Jeotgalibacillus salarius]|uniref:Uncharacterized protein n=1 Tax=Jeotgalibacillus salarius TaxID=546023 RepID=A0A4Y8LHV8_9BACL|nr:hypothetical protein [Jeotgalibacillus salarius]TFE02416.1 hypothetical protein E2626_07520 [Jeotgalibacillus salarius]
MKKIIPGLILISVLAIISTTFFYDNSQHSAESKDSAVKQTEEANNIIDDISQSKLQVQITEKLKQEGYTPTGTYGFSIYSFENKSITIDLSEIPKAKEAAEKHIQEIVNDISQENQLGIFKTTIQ